VDDLLSRVQAIFAEVTRYPAEVLDPAADLEDDLGIDSVKRAEILAVFRDRFGLPETLQIAPEQLRTIASISEVVRGAMGDQVKGAPLAVAEVTFATVPPAAALAPVSAPVSFEAPPVVAPPLGNGLSRERVRSLVLETMAEVTRYPADLLVSDASLEDDLGIDSDKLAKVVAAVRSRMGVGAATAETARPVARTVGDLVAAAQGMIPSPPSPAASFAVTALGGPANGPAGRIPNGRANGAGNGPTWSLFDREPAEPALERWPGAVPGPRAFKAHTNARPFEGKVALITGSGHGLGRAIAVRLSELGGRVVVNSFHSRERGEQTAQEIRAAGGDAHHIWASVAKPEALKAMFDEVGDRYGKLDFFVSNASNGMIAPLEYITLDHWDRAFRTNVIALHQGAMLAAKLMRPRGGRIVTISSPGAHRYVPYFGCMGTVKAAMESLTRYLAIELGPDNIQVNCISAGPIYGELLNKFPEADRLIPYWESLAAGKRLAEEKDLAHFVMYLLSAESHWITGSVLLADSGGTQRI
jgi:NAD(P)-dependent dehydrogenase (short-subunit alcohol dehydrogenase family)/acyl carrier protein